MRKFLLLGAAALMVPSVAFADGEETHNVFGGVYGGWTQMDMPEHALTPYQFNFGGGFVNPTLQADVDGWSFGAGIGKELDSGWRVLATARFFDGDGSAAGAFTIPNATPFRRAALDGVTGLVSGGYGGVGNATQNLTAGVTEFGATVSAGRQLFDMVHGDIVMTYTGNSTDDLHTAHIILGAGPFYEDVKTRTAFSSNSVELAARASLDFPLGGGLSAGVGGSAGYAYRHTDMNVAQSIYFSSTNSITSSKLGHKDGDYGFIGRVDANVSYGITDRTSIAVVGSYVSDSLVPVLVAPDYVAGTAATFQYETQSSTSYGLRLLTRW
jgi:hypothetical protein